MKKNWLIFLWLIAPCVVTAQTVYDRAYVLPFEKNNDIEAYTGFRNAVFRFRPKVDDTLITRHKLMANTSASFGVAFDYNWLSIDYSFSIPGTAVANQAPTIHTWELHLKKTGPHFRAGIDITRYFGLVMPLDRRTQSFDYFHDIVYRRYGLEFTFILNAEKFALPAGTGFSMRQRRSAGSLIITALPFYQRFSLSRNPQNGYSQKDSAFLDAVGNNPDALSMLVRTGYAYTRVWQEGLYSVHGSVEAGTGLQDRWPRLGQPAIRPIFNYRLALTAGYNGDQWYGYFRAAYEKWRTYQVGSVMNTRNDNFGITVGYRIGQWKHKIFGVL